MKRNRNFDPPVPAVIAGHSWINLGDGFFAKVDLEDYPIINSYSWYIMGRYTYSAKLGTSMHRFILNAPPDKDVDHINGNRFDNRKSNLRLCSKSENLANSKKRKGTKSRFKGVNWDNEFKKWRVFIQSKSIGRFKDELEAARAYDKRAVELYGEFACTNETLKLYDNL